MTGLSIALVVCGLLAFAGYWRTLDLRHSKDPLPIDEINELKARLGKLEMLILRRGR